MSNYFSTIVSFIEGNAQPMAAPIRDVITKMVDTASGYLPAHECTYEPGLTYCSLIDEDGVHQIEFEVDTSAVHAIAEQLIRTKGSVASVTDCIVVTFLDKKGSVVEPEFHTELAASIRSSTGGSVIHVTTECRFNEEETWTCRLDLSE